MVIMDHNKYKKIRKCNEVTGPNFPVSLSKAYITVQYQNFVAILMFQLALENSISTENERNTKYWALILCIKFTKDTELLLS